MMLNKRRIWFSLLGILLMLSCGYLVYWLSEYQKYDKTFAVIAEAAVPKMGELNNHILSELSPPLGVEFTEQKNIEPWSPLGTRMYYVYLHAEYKITQASPEDIVRHYQNLLKNLDWQESQYDLIDPTPDDFYTYYRGSSELKLSIYYSQYMQKYTIDISNDLWSQSFSPPKPNRTIETIWCYFHPGVCTLPATLVKN